MLVILHLEFIVGSGNNAMIPELFPKHYFKVTGPPIQCEQGGRAGVNVRKVNITYKPVPIRPIAVDISRDF